MGNSLLHSRSGGRGSGWPGGRTLLLMSGHKLIELLIVTIYKHTYLYSRVTCLALKGARQ